MKKYFCLFFWLLIANISIGQTKKQPLQNRKIRLNDTPSPPLEQKGHKILTPEIFGALGNGVNDDATAIQTAIDKAKEGDLVKMEKKYFVGKTIKLKSNIQINLKGTIIAGHINNVIFINNVTGLIWSGGLILGDGITPSQVGVMINNSNNNIIQALEIKNTLNKGIGLKSSDQLTQNNKIINVVISGCTSSTGAGISLWGKGVKNNRISSAKLTKNRIGLTINGASNNIVTNVNASYNWLIGIAVDGIISEAGDGGNYNLIEDCVTNYNGDNNHRSYGGIYLGNGSSNNEFKKISTIGNYGAGVKTAGGKNNKNIQNSFSEITSHYNRLNGINLISCFSCNITNSDISNNIGKGIHLLKSDNSSIGDIKLRNNSLQGISIQSTGVQKKNIDSTSLK
jgi:hypothetical protein